MVQRQWSVLAVPVLIVALGLRSIGAPLYSVNQRALRQTLAPDRLLGRLHACHFTPDTTHRLYGQRTPGLYGQRAPGLYGQRAPRVHGQRAPAESVLLGR
ncbi:MAG: hypothetical protein ACHQ7M_10690 [Chloroflexota bacterium]